MYIFRGRTYSVGGKRVVNESLKGSFCDETPKSCVNTNSNKYSEDAYVDARRLKPSEVLIRKHCNNINTGASLPHKNDPKSKKSLK